MDSTTTCPGCDGLKLTHTVDYTGDTFDICPVCTTEGSMAAAVVSASVAGVVMLALVFGIVWLILRIAS